MSSLYEDELNRLLKEKKARIRLFKKQGAKSKEVGMLNAEVEILEAELKRYQKAMERFRAKPFQSVAGQGVSTSEVS